MTSILLDHGYIVTVDPERRVIEDGWIHVVGDSIAAIGPVALAAGAFCTAGVGACGAQEADFSRGPVVARRPQEFPPIASWNGSSN